MKTPCLWWGTRGDAEPVDPLPKSRRYLAPLCYLLKHDTYLYQWQREGGHVTMCCHRCGRRNNIEFAALDDWVQRTIVSGWTKQNFILWADRKIELYAMGYKLP